MLWVPELQRGRAVAVERGWVGTPALPWPRVLGPLGLRGGGHADSWGHIRPPRKALLQAAVSAPVPLGGCAISSGAQRARGDCVRVGTSRSCQGLFGRHSAAAEHSSCRRAWGEAPRRAEMPLSVLARAAPCPWWCASILAGRRRQAVYTARLGKSRSESFSLLLYRGH